MTAAATTIARHADARPQPDTRTRAGAGGRADNHLVKALDRAGHRLTEPRRAVAGLVAGRDGHFTAAEIVADARRRRMDIGRATVFRTLDLFASLSLVERIDLPGGEHAYVACDPVHHHHAICTGCGRSRTWPTTASPRCWARPAAGRDSAHRPIVNRDLRPLRRLPGSIVRRGVAIIAAS